MRAILAVLALTLTACSRPPPEPAPPARSAPAPPAAARVQDYSRPITARGNEPFWALTLVGTQLTLKRPGQPDTVFIAPGAQITPGQARWTATSADGRTLTLTLFQSACSDGMSELSYPMTAEVAVDGGTLDGCAILTAQIPPPPR
jgi:uncharacterized membrane protein